MRYSGSLASGAAMAAMAAAALSKVDHHYGRTRYIGGYKAPRSKYRPHQGEAEVSRRLRHAERDDANQRARAGREFFAQVEGIERMSRRGRIIA